MWPNLAQPVLVAQPLPSEIKFKDKSSTNTSDSSLTKVIQEDSEEKKGCTCPIYPNPLSKYRGCRNPYTFIVNVTPSTPSPSSR